MSNLLKRYGLESPESIVLTCLISKICYNGGSCLFLEFRKICIENAQRENQHC